MAFLKASSTSSKAKAGRRGQAAATGCLQCAQVPSACWTLKEPTDQPCSEEMEAKEVDSAGAPGCGKEAQAPACSPRGRHNKQRPLPASPRDRSRGMDMDHSKGNLCSLLLESFPHAMRTGQKCSQASISGLYKHVPWSSAVPNSPSGARSPAAQAGSEDNHVGGEYVRETESQILHKTLRALDQGPRKVSPRVSTPTPNP